jgi:hypothetical protein
VKPADVSIVGTVDGTYVGLDAENRNQHCPVRSTCSNQWYCTRAVGHTGDHVGHYSDGKVAGTWPQHPAESSHDPTNPAHYRAGAVETIDAIRAALGDVAFIGFCRGNVMKYRARAGLKTTDPAEDLAKAAWYEAMAWHVAGHGADPRTYRPAGGAP